MHENSKLLFAKYVLDRIAGGLVLEVGPESMPSIGERMVRERGSECVWEYLELDPACRTTYTAISEYEYPLPDGACDIVYSGQVIEHVRKPWVWMRELARIAKPGGLVITIGPVSWPYHEAPIDCWRIYPVGMRSLYEDAGLVVELCVCESLEPGVVDTVAVGRRPHGRDDVVAG